jgi:AraC-like DNA-binding protein
MPVATSGRTVGEGKERGSGEVGEGILSEAENARRRMTTKSGKAKAESTAGINARPTERLKAEGMKGAYVVVPVEVARCGEISDGAFRTYCVLRRYCFGRRTYCWPSMKTLAGERGCSEETIRRHVGEIAGAGLVRVERKGRHNMYWFEGVEGKAEVQKPRGRGVETVPPQILRSESMPADVGSCASFGCAQDRQDDSLESTGKAKEATACHPRGLEARGYSCRSQAQAEKPTPSETGDSCGVRGHSGVGQGFSKEEKKTTVVVAHERIKETTAQLVAQGVASGAARRLVDAYGEEMCRYALELLEWEQGRGLRVRNTGGWLYSAVTKGFVRVEEEAAEEKWAAEGAATMMPAAEVKAAEEQHLARIDERRREALRRRGISDEADELWARVRARMSERGQGSRLLAAAFLRPVGEAGVTGEAGEKAYAIEGAGGGIAERLKELLPAIEEAVREEVGGRVRVEVGG